jgi:hypothetical protein
MNSFRYTLSPSVKKTNCPSCNQKRFRPALDNETGEILPEYGRCDRVNSCGFFEMPDGKIKTDRPAVQIPTVDQNFISQELVNRTLTAYDRNPFVMWLAELLNDEDLARQIALKWLIGTSRDSHSIFWQSTGEHVLNGHLMGYDVEGHRTSPNYHVMKESQGYFTGLYGLHRIESTKTLAIVESEKTAILASLYYPKYDWIATNGSNLGTRKISQINTKAILFPDADVAGRNGFKRLSDNLERRGIENNTVHLFPDRMDGYDLADYIIEDLRSSKPKGYSQILGYPVNWNIP